MILLDVMLRGLSGCDICRKIRADPTLRSIPIILLTVWDDPNVGTTGRAAGADLTLSKPADAQTLRDAIERVWRERGGATRSNSRRHDDPVHHLSVLPSPADVRAETE